MRRFERLSFGLASALALSACAPINPALRIDSVVVGSPASASFSIDPNTATMRGSRLVVRGPVDPNQNGIRIDVADPASPLALGVLPPGRYSGELSWRYQRLFSGTPESISASPADFQVMEPGGCFSFNFGSPPANAVNWTPNTQGWSASRFMQGDSDVPVPLPATPGLTVGSEQLVASVPADPLNWPTPRTLRHTDIQSPPLASNPAWQAARGLRYAVGGTPYASLDLRVQSILVVRKADGSTEKFAEGTPENRVFHRVGNWTAVTSPIPLPPGSTVVGAIVRVFGMLPLPPGNDVRVILDDICPLP